MMKHTIALITPSTEEGQRIHDQLAEYQVVVCSNQQELEESCRRCNIQLLICDEECEKALFSSLRQTRPWLTGLLLSSHSDPQLLLNALHSGFSGIILRELSGEQLRETIRQHLEIAGLREENTRLRTLLPLYSLSERFLTSRSEQEVLDCLLDVVVDQIHVRQCSVMLFDQTEQCLRIVASRGLDRDLLDTIRVQPGSQISGWVYEKGRPVILNRDSQADSMFAALLKRPEIAAAISFPMMREDRIIGVLNISQLDGQSSFSEADNEMLAVICSQAVLALENVGHIRAAQQKTRERTLLEQYVAPEVAELLLARESSLESVGDIREVTVLFADIRNFTNLVQHLQLEQLRSFLNEFFSLFTETVFQYRGTVDKFMGDAVLAIFGAPVQLASSCQEACRAALQLRRGFHSLRGRWADQRDDFRRVDLGMGLTHGQMFVGNVGSATRMDYTVIGTQVNVAQRLAAESTACEIYLTEAVREALDDTFKVTAKGPVWLRGVERELVLFSLQG